MIKLKSGVKIKNGTKLKGILVSQQQLITITLTRSPDLITIVNNAGGVKVTYFQGSSKTNTTIMPLPLWTDTTYTAPFTPAAGAAYKFVVVGVWNQYEQLIAANTLMYVL